MSADQIKNVLKQLHEDLAVTASVDPELKSLLQELDHDIQKLLLAGHSNPTAIAAMTARLEDVAADFSVKHPQISGLLRRLVYGLGQMGI